MLEKWQNHLIFWGILLLLALVYMPVYQSYYANAHDYNILTRGFDNYDSHLSNLLGRPVAALITSITSSLIWTFRDANIARFLVIILFGISAFIFYRWLRSNSISLTHSLLLVTAIFTLPPFQVCISMMSIGTKFVPCLLITICASLIAFKGTDQITTFKTALNRHVFAAAVLLLVSLLIHPSVTMFYWVMLSVPLVGPESDSFLRKKQQLIALFSLPFISCGTYFIFGSLMLHDVSVGDSWKFAISSNLMGKTKWFLDYPLIYSLNLWNVPPSKIVAYIVFFVIFSGMLAGTVKMIINRHKRMRNEKMQIISRRFQQYFLIICLFPLSLLPNISASSTASPYRILIALSPLTVIILFWAINNIGSVLPDRKCRYFATSILVVISLFGVYSAHYNVMNYFVFPATTEIRFIKSALLQNDLTNIDRIHVMRPEANFIRDKKLLLAESEFGILYSTGGATKMIKALLNEMDITPKGKTFSVSYSSGNSSIYWSNPDTLIIDMRRLHGFFDTSPRSNMDLKLEKTIISSHPLSTTGGQLAFSRNKKSQFWETCGAYPHWIQMDFSNNPKTIAAYALQISDTGSAKRAPKEWEFQSSNDGLNWVTLDLVKDQVGWKDNEKRDFNIINTTAFRYFRLYITGGNSPKLTRVHELHLYKSDGNEILP